jgi:class 3 adenylate cyclase
VNAQIVAYVTLAAAAWLLVLGFFVFGLRQRWFARFESGFFISVVLALVGVALMSASVVGIWGYLAARQILEEEIVRELQDVGGIIEAQILSQLDDVERQLTGLGRSLADAIAKKAPVADLTERMNAAQSFNANFLQLRLFDASGARVIALTTTTGGETEPINPIGVGFNLAGQPWISEVYFSPQFQRETLHISLPITDASKTLRGIISARFDLRAEFTPLIRGSKFNQSGYATIVDGEGQIVAHPDGTRLEKDVSSYPAVQQAWLTGGVGRVVAPNADGQMRLFAYRAMKNPGVLAKRPWVLLTEIDQGEEVAPLKRLERELGLGMALLLVGSFFIARGMSLSLTKPLVQLGTFAGAIGTGDLTARVDLAGKDVAGQLAETLNRMAVGLQERDHVKEVFGRYIATQVSDKILKGQVNLGGETRNVSILFSDIRNFTGMSEQMTPQQVVAFLNDYFSEMVDAVFEQDGILDKFMGDGLMAIFGSLGDQPDHPRRAVRAALRMKSLLAKINGERATAGKPAIVIGIGIHTDEVIVGNIGSRKRLEYTVVGDGVNTSSRLQGLNKEFGTTILISETTYAAVQDEFECRQMPEAQLRGKTKELRFYEVISVRTPATTG